MNFLKNLFASKKEKSEKKKQLICQGRKQKRKKKTYGKGEKMCKRDIGGEMKIQKIRRCLGTQQKQQIEFYFFKQKTAYEMIW